MNKIKHVNETIYEKGIEISSKGGKHTKLQVAFHLFPHKAHIKICEVLYHGALKYGVDNWKNISIEDHLNHALYHINQYFITKEKYHLSNASCRILFALNMSEETSND